MASFSSTSKGTRRHRVSASTNLPHRLQVNGMSETTTDATGVTVSLMFHDNEPSPKPRLWERAGKAEINVPISDVVK